MNSPKLKMKKYKSEATTKELSNEEKLEATK